MSNTNGSAQTRAKNKYNAKTYDDLHIFVKKGKREKLKVLAAACGDSLNGFVIKAINEKIERDNMILLPEP